MTSERSIDLSIEVPGTPEEVWEAIATGPGITSWFVPTTVEERPGGVVELDFGSLGKDTGEVVAWEAPRRVVFTSAEIQGRRLAFEWTVEARDGTCVVRLVNSGFGPEGSEWSGDYDGMTEGWKIFFQNLRLHLEHFRGRHAHTVNPLGMLPGPNVRGWATLCEAAGIAPDLGPGDRFTATADGLEPLNGIVDSVIARPAARAMLIRFDGVAPGHGFVAAEGDGDQVACSFQLYLYGDDAPRVASAWDQHLSAALRT